MNSGRRGETRLPGRQGFRAPAGLLHRADGEELCNLFKRTQQQSEQTERLMSYIQLRIRSSSVIRQQQQQRVYICAEFHSNVLYHMKLYYTIYSILYYYIPERREERVQLESGPGERKGFARRFRSCSFQLALSRPRSIGKGASEEEEE